MRFCDLFISYKIGLKGIKSTIPFTKLPLYRKIFVIIFFASAIVSGILLLFKLTLASYIPIVFFASTNYLKMQRHFPKVAAGNSSKLHKLPGAC